MAPIKKVSLVTPVYNEEGCLREFYTRSVAALERTGYEYEIIFTDDGSRDNSTAVLREIAAGDNRVKVIFFTRNFGQTAAMSAGIDLASGDLIVTIDSDLQNDVNDIPMMIQALLENNVDVVSGWRKNRQDETFTRKFPSWCANRLISNISGLRLHDYGCSLKVYRGKALKQVNLYGEMHRFIPALVVINGGKVLEVPVNHFPRTIGKSKYGLERVLKVFLDLFLIKFMVGYSTRPIQFFGKFGLFMMSIGGLTSLYVLWSRYVSNIQGALLIPLILLSLFLLVIGMQTILIGLLGEIGIRTYHECQKEKHIYVVSEVLNQES